MDLSPVQALKELVVTLTGLSKDALHIHVGLAVFLLAAVLLRRPLRSPVPWLAVLAVALAGETVDALDELRASGQWTLGAGVHDLANTLLWPTVLMLAARFARRGAPERGTGR